jgi:hypothetical protein
LNNDQVVNAIKDYIPVAVDIDDNPDLAREYGIDAIPAFVIVTSTGAHADKDDSIGYSTPAEFIAWLSSRPPR